MNNKKIVLHVSGNVYPKIDVNHHTKDIWINLSKDFDEYHVLARFSENKFYHGVDGKIELHLMPKIARSVWPFFFLSFLLPFYIKNIKPSCIVVQCPVFGGVAAAVYGRIYNIPIFLEIHGAYYFKNTRGNLIGKIEFFLYKLFSGFSMGRAKKIRSLSEDMSESITNIYGEKLKNKIAIVPTRVNLNKFNGVKRDYRIKNAIKIVSVGSLSHRKNYINLIHDVYKSGINFELHIIGGGELKASYLELAKSLNIESKLFLYGAVGQDVINKVLENSDVYIQYSLSEGLPRAILEAMAIGLPVVSTNVGYIKNVLNNNDNAIVLSEPWDVSLKAELIRLYNDFELREKLGKNGRRTVINSYESEVIFLQYRNQINSIIQ